MGAGEVVGFSSKWSNPQSFLHEQHNNSLSRGDIRYQETRATYKPYGQTS